MADIVEWLRETSKPPPGVELRSHDGTTYTGVLVVERSELVMMLAVRHPTGTVVEHARPPIVTPPPGSQRTLFRTFSDLDPDDPRWDQDGDPFRR